MKVAFVILFSIFAFVGCGGEPLDGGGSWDGEVVQRAQSPDRNVDAIMVDGSTGATSGFSSRLYIVPSGTNFDKTSDRFGLGKDILRADGVQGLAIAWKGPNTLEITYGSARIFHFTNFVDYRDSGETMKRYDIKLHETSK